MTRRKKQPLYSILSLTPSTGFRAVFLDVLSRTTHTLPIACFALCKRGKDSENFIEPLIINPETRNGLSFIFDYAQFVSLGYVGVGESVEEAFKDVLVDTNAFLDNLDREEESEEGEEDNEDEDYH